MVHGVKCCRKIDHRQYMLAHEEGGGPRINVSFLLNGRLSEDTIILPTVMATLISFSYCGDLCGEIKFQQLAGLNNHYTVQQEKEKRQTVFMVTIYKRSRLSTRGKKR